MPSDIHQFSEATTGSFAAIYQGVRDFRKELAKVKSPNELKKSSIMRAQKDLVLSFPVLCTDTLRPDTSMLICKAVERNAVSALQQLFSAAHIQGSNAMDVISQFHTNMDNNMDVSDYMDYAAAAVRNANNYKVGGSAVRAADSFFRMGTFGEAAKQEFAEQCRHFYPESSFSEKSLNDYLVSENYNGYDVREYNSKSNYITEDTNNRNNKNNRQKIKVDKATWDELISNNDLDYEKAKLAVQAQSNANNRASNNEKNNLERQKLMHQIENDRQNAQHNYLTKQLLPTDVQKINELVPTPMLLRFYVDDDKSIETVHECIIGVKARLIPASSEAIIDKVGNYKKGGVNQFELVRATTKEISFGKDFVAAIKDAKIDARKDSLSQTSPVWRSLQGRSSSSTAKRLVHGRNTAAAITTLVISQQEVESIKINYRVAIDSVNEAVAFMAKFNLMGLVIVDEQSEIAKFILDGDKYFASYTLAALDRQGKGFSDSQVANILAAVRR